MYKEIHNVISNKFNILFCYNEHGIMIFYDETICLLDTTSITNNLLLQLLIKNTQDIVHIIAIYKPPKMQISYFTSILETTLKKIPINCPIIIVGGFNIEMLTKPSQSIILQKFMNDISLLDIPQTCILHI